MRVEFSDFRDLFTGLPPGALSLDDVRTTESCIYEDRRITVFYAPFDYLNQAARVVLVGVTPGPTQMLASYEIVRDALQASRTHQDALQMVKARASFKGMRRDLARWLDDLNLAAVLGLRSCSELFEDTHRALLHTTSAVRYPVFVRSRDGSLRNYSGRNPQFETHPWLCEMVETVLAAELSALPATIVVPLGAASSAITQLCDLGVLNPARCLLGLPHPSPASAFRERYFQAAKSHLISQVQNLDPMPGGSAHGAHAPGSRPPTALPCPKRVFPPWAQSPGSAASRDNASPSGSARATSTTTTSLCAGIWAFSPQTPSGLPMRATDRADCSSCTLTGTLDQCRPTSPETRRSSAAGEMSAGSSPATTWPKATTS